jgi:hypothetical protein
MRVDGLMRVAILACVSPQNLIHSHQLWTASNFDEIWWDARSTSHKHQWLVSSYPRSTRPLRAEICTRLGSKAVQTFARNRFEGKTGTIVLWRRQFESKQSHDRSCGRLASHVHGATLSAGNLTKILNMTKLYHRSMNLEDKFPR